MKDTVTVRKSDVERLGKELINFILNFNIKLFYFFITSPPLFINL